MTLNVDLDLSNVISDIYSASLPNFVNIGLVIFELSQRE